MRRYSSDKRKPGSRSQRWICISPTFHHGHGRLKSTLSWKTQSLSENAFCTSCPSVHMTWIGVLIRKYFYKLEKHVPSKVKITLRINKEHHYCQQGNRFQLKQGTSLPKGSYEESIEHSQPTITWIGELISSSQRQVWQGWSPSSYYTQSTSFFFFCNISPGPDIKKTFCNSDISAQKDSRFDIVWLYIADGIDTSQFSQLWGWKAHQLGKTDHIRQSLHCRDDPYMAWGSWFGTSQLKHADGWLIDCWPPLSFLFERLWLEFLFTRLIAAGATRFLEMSSTIGFIVNVEFFSTTVC